MDLEKRAYSFVFSWTEEHEHHADGRGVVRDQRGAALSDGHRATVDGWRILLHHLRASRD